MSGLELATAHAVLVASAMWVGISLSAYRAAIALGVAVGPCLALQHAY
jgi:hypothetical protein